MANAVMMPQAGQSMTEGKIIQWFFKEGDKVRRGDPIFEIETDKANMDVESPADGVLHKILHEAGATVDVLKVVAIIASDGESVDVDAVIKDAESQSGATSDGGSNNGSAPAAAPPKCQLEQNLPRMAVEGTVVEVKRGEPVPAHVVVGDGGEQPGASGSVLSRLIAIRRSAVPVNMNGDYRPCRGRCRRCGRAAASASASAFVSA